MAPQLGAIWLYSNSSAITQVAMDVPANRFIQTVAPLDNVPWTSIDGTTGVLYNRDDSCSPSTTQQPIPFPFYDADPKSTKVPKIALIKKQGGDCTLVQKILNAEHEGAIGAIVYDTLSNATHDQDRKAVKITFVPLPPSLPSHSLSPECCIFFLIEFLYIRLIFVLGSAARERYYYTCIFR